MSRTLILSLVAALAVVAAGEAQYSILSRAGEVNELLHQTLSGQDPSILGAATSVVTQRKGFEWPSSKGFGFGDPTKSKVMGLDACVSMNTLYEVLIAAAAVKLQQDTAFTNSLDDAIATTFTPRSVSLVNPTTNRAITYKQLLMHTSTVLDNGFEGYARTVPATVGTLAAFVEAYFTTATGQLIASVFSSQEPGTSRAHSFARANIALTAYILERVIVVRSLAFSGIADYIDKTFSGPLGLSSTFFLAADGSAPGTTPEQSFAGTYTAPNFLVAAPYAASYAGCIADSDGQRTIHPAWPADYMGYTTVADVGRLAHGLFISDRFRTVANAMKQLFVIETGTHRITSQSGVGIGLIYVDGSALCSVGVTTGVINVCPLTNSTATYGYVTARDRVHVGFVCSDSTRIGAMCVVGAVTYTTAALREPTPLLANVAASFQDLSGVVVVGTGTTATIVAAPVKDEWFGVYVFIGAYATVATVYLVTRVLIFWGLRIAVAVNTETGGAAKMATPDRGDMF